MAKNNKTIFQRLGGVLKGHSGSNSVVDNFVSNSFEPNKILFQTSDKEVNFSVKHLLQPDRSICWSFSL